MTNSRRISVCLTLLFVLIIGTSASPIAIASSDDDHYFEITVQATGDTRVTPDLAQIRVGAETTADTAQEALAENNQVLLRLQEIFTEFTTPDVIKTSEFNLYRRDRWDSETQQNIPDGFTIRHVFEVSLEDLESVATMLDQATDAGANIIYGLQYRVQDDREAREQAFINAVENAHWQAEVLATAGGGQQPKLVSLEETQFYGPAFSAEGGGTVSEQANAFMPGQLKITVNLTAKFKAMLTEVN